MTKKVKFPLKMADGALIKDLDELREHFDIESILGYYADGKLKEWLDNFYYESESEQLSALDANSPDFKIRLCKLLGAACPKDITVDMDEIAKKNARIAQLKQFTADDEIIKNIDKVAFNQEDLANFLDEDADTIYLCGSSFTIPVRKENVIYIGVNHPVVNISSKKIIDFAAKNIVFKDIVFCESYQGVLGVSGNESNSEERHSEALFGRDELAEIIYKIYRKFSAVTLLHLSYGFGAPSTVFSYDKSLKAKPRAEIAESIHVGIGDIICVLTFNNNAGNICFTDKSIYRILSEDTAKNFCVKYDDIQEIIYERGDPELSIITKSETIRSIEKLNRDNVDKACMVNGCIKTFLEIASGMFAFNGNDNENLKSIELTQKLHNKLFGILSEKGIAIDNRHGGVNDDGQDA